MQMENLNFYILTGGPGSGKSTVLKLLSDMGYLTVEETGRNIIQKQIKSLGDAVPWNNVSRYARLMFLPMRSPISKNLFMYKKHVSLTEAYSTF